MNTVNTLIEKINSAKSLDFGNIFSDSIELFKKTWLQGFLLQLFTLIIMLPLIIVLYVPLIAAIIAQQESGYANESFESFIAGISVLYIVFILAGVLVLGAISVGLNAGFYRIMRKLDNNEVTTTSDFFYFIKGKYLSKIFILMLASFGIAIVAALLCYLPVFYVMVPLSLFAIVLAFNPELSVGEIVKVSFKLGNKKWLLIFGLLLLSGLLAEIVGLMLCGIGLLFTAAFPYHPIYLIYKDVIGFDEVTAIEEIGTHIE